eukprot:scaffold18060_cov55-Attheya_sp.AAC.2
MFKGKESVTDSPTLEELRRANQERWRTIERLHEELNNNNNDYDHDENDDQQGDDDGIVDSAESDLANALSSELHVLHNQQLQHTQSLQLGSQNNNAQEGNFGTELISTYAELQQVHATLDRRQQQMADQSQSRLQNFTQEARHVQHALQELLRQQQSRDMSNPSQQDGVETHNHAAQTERQWLQQELGYVEEQIIARRRQEEQEQMEEDPDEAGRTGLEISQQRSSASMVNLLSRLAHLLVVSPLDPYIDISELDFEDFMLDFLLESGVLQRHSSHPSLIRMINYQL